MGFRLVGIEAGGRLELLLRAGKQVIGSGPECDLRLDHDSVSRRHAELSVSGETVTVADLGSRNGISIGGRRISTPVPLGVGDEIVLGMVQLRLEAVAENDLGTALELGSGGDSEVPGRVSSTLGLEPVSTFALQHLPGLLDLVAAGAAPLRVAQQVGTALFESFPVISVRILTRNEEDEQGVVFEAERLPGQKGSRGAPVQVTGDRVAIAVSFATQRTASAYAPMVRAAACLVLLAYGGSAPREPLPSPVGPPLPEPATVDETVRRIYADAVAVARGNVGVLIGGESGTGKEVLARYMHAASARSRQPFVALNCAALPRDLLESELFGIERGVATGVDARPGKFESANNGTLFLDEIGDMDLETQASILRVLQEGEVYRVGSTEPRRADVRIIAATNRDIGELLAAERFREDLYYRIATWEVSLPPLRKRRADILNLAVYFLEREARNRGVRVAGISQAALQVLMSSRWPGNVRQLEKEMARAVLFLSDGGVLSTVHLTPRLVEESGQLQAPTLAASLEELEKRLITQALYATLGDVPMAAQALGMPRSTLYRRLKVLGVYPSTFEVARTGEERS